MKILQLITSFLVGLAVGWVLCAWAPHLPSLFKWPPGPEGILSLPPDVAQQINLSPQQREQIKGVEISRRQLVEGEREALGRAQDDFERAIAEASSTEVLRGLFAKLLKARTDMEQAQFETMMKVHAILRPEQIRQLQRMKPSRPGQGMPPPPHDLPAGGRPPQGPHPGPPPGEAPLLPPPEGGG